MENGQGNLNGMNIPPQGQPQQSSNQSQDDSFAAQFYQHLDNNLGQQNQPDNMTPNNPVQNIPENSHMSTIPEQNSVPVNPQQQFNQQLQGSQLNVAQEQENVPQQPNPVEQQPPVQAPQQPVPTEPPAPVSVPQQPVPAANAQSDYNNMQAQQMQQPQQPTNNMTAPVPTNNMNNQNQASSNVPQQSGAPKKETNPKKIIMIIAIVAAILIVGGIAIGVISCTVSNMPSSGSETYPKEQASDITASTKHGARVKEILEERYPGCKNKIHLVKVDRESDSMTSSGGSASGSYEFEDEDGTQFEAHYSKYVYISSYSPANNKNDETLKDDYYTTIYNKELSTAITSDLKNKCSKYTCCAVSANYYDTSDKATPTKDEYCSKAEFRVTLFTGDKGLDLEKAGDTIKNVLNSKSKETSVRVVYNGKIDYDKITSGNTINFSNTDMDSNSDFKYCANIKIERNGTVKVDDFRSTSLK